MRLLAAFILALAVDANAAGDASGYAILSLLGDRLTLVAHVGQTGTSFSSERRNTVKVGTPELDKAVLLAADKAVKAARPDAKVTLLLTQQPEIYESQATLMDPDSAIETLLPAVLPLAAPSQARLLVLVTKIRYDAQVVIRSGNVAFGKLDGLGFYVDTNRPMYNIKTGAEYRGLVAPYAHFRASLVDIASGRVLKQEIVHVATTMPSASGLGTWESITPQEKIAALGGMLDDEVYRAVGRLLQSAP